MKSVVRLAPGKPEVMLYWSDRGDSNEAKPLLRQKKRNRKAWLRHELADLDDWETDPILVHRKGYALPR